MKYPIYEQCENSIKQALDALERLKQRQAISEATVRAIRLRRRTADIAMQATFEELQHAFITPIDREELLRLRQITEAVLCRVEDTVLMLFRRHQPTLHPNDNSLLAAVNDECRLLQETIESFSTHPRSDAVFGRLVALERQHRKSEEQDGSEQNGASLKKISAACATATEVIRYILLKVT
ncbi:MAG: DUF47 family protein [Clostridia bacterium]|nr:DUF47 family protein [Clostridia bacterium]MBQ4318191.1 DUF47 family protein [Clostridia bacterium]